jgi:hypothetical protein
MKTCRVEQHSFENGNPNFIMEACRVGTTLIWNPDSTMETNILLWKPRFYGGRGK